MTSFGLLRVQHLGAEPHALERARPIVLDQHVAALDQLEQQLLAARVAQVERDALLVAGIDLPVQRLAADLPVAQRIALAGVLDLDHLGAEIGQLQRQHVAGDQPRQVEDRDAVERAACGGVVGGHGIFLGLTSATLAPHPEERCRYWLAKAGVVQCAARLEG